MNLNKAGNINNRFKQRMSQYATTNTMPQTRNLRVDRQLQTWCRDYCPRYGCSWCKANDAVFGVDCSRYCRRREEEELQPHDRELQTDGMATFVSDQNKFTSQQAATCSAMLASMVRDPLETGTERRWCVFSLHKLLVPHSQSFFCSLR
jgi:hypothetical protein